MTGTISCVLNPHISSGSTTLAEGWSSGEGVGSHGLKLVYCGDSLMTQCEEEVLQHFKTKYVLPSIYQ